MLGAILGDIIGSSYEFSNTKVLDFDLFPKTAFFTDDTLLTVATAYSLLNSVSFEKSYTMFTNQYPDLDYGASFYKWILSDIKKPYNSYGNGSAMRVSPVVGFYNTQNDILNWSEKTAVVTHNHPEGIKGAQATSLAAFLLKIKKSKSEVKSTIENKFQYNLDNHISEHTRLAFDESCQGTVPYAIQCVLSSDNFENAVRKAILLGGDSDTMACIAGSIAEYAFGIPEHFAMKIYEYLPSNFIEIIERFYKVTNQKTYDVLVSSK